jgi:hypothetical protein
MAVVELNFNQPKRRNEYSIEEFLPEIISDIDDAIDYFEMELVEDLDKGLRYFNGEVDLPTFIGRSKAVSTQVRDAIRNLKPSILRVLTSSSAIVKYIPTNIQIAAVVEQQEAYVHQLFWRNGGYEILRDSTDEALKMGLCPVKTYWQPIVPPTYAELTMLTLEEIAQLEQMPDVSILDVSPTTSETPVGGIDDLDLDLYDVELEQVHANGKIVNETVPVDEFFISKNARSTDEAKVHGHIRIVKVAEAIEMGLDYDDWFNLDEGDDNTAENFDKPRSGSAKTEVNEDRGDVLSHRFQLIEAYVRIDLEDAGTEQLYCVYLGGSSRELLGWTRETESPFDICCPDPKPFTTRGTAVPELMMQMQDVMSSLLRSTIDNAHASNHPRLAGDPAKVNFDDVLRHDLAHPVRMKQGAQIQVIAVPSTLQGSLPLLQWLETDSQQKMGITKAAQGLDPDALQSTDKEAVRNTIMLSQGQVELMVRNIVHSLCIPMFRKMLRLSIQHLDRYQIIRMQGQFLPVDQILFDPTMYAEPHVGLGTADETKRTMGLQFTLQQQLMLVERLGMDNPFVTAAQIYNTLEDMTKMFGLHNVGRYFNMVTPEVEQKFVEQKKQEAAEAAKQGQPMDPAMALLESENIKAGTEKLKIMASSKADAIKAQLDALKVNAQDDLERDRMTQERELKTAELLGKFGVQIDANQIKREQATPRNTPTGGNAGT